MVFIRKPFQRTDTLITVLQQIFKIWFLMMFLKIISKLKSAFQNVCHFLFFRLIGIFELTEAATSRKQFECKVLIQSRYFTFPQQWTSEWRQTSQVSCYHFNPLQEIFSVHKSFLWFSHSVFLFVCFVFFSRSVLSDSLQPHRLQHARLPCPSPGNH